MKQAISTQQLEDAYDAYGTAVYRLAMAFLGQCADAEGVTQETFCRLLYRAPSFKEEPSEALASPGCSQSVPEPTEGLLAETGDAVRGHHPCHCPRGTGGPECCHGPAGTVQAAYPSLLL